MTEECRFCLGEAQSLLFKVVEDLASGNIVLSQLKIVLENPQALVENATVVGPWFNEVPDSKVLSAIIEQRKAELNDLHECKGNVNELLSICRDLGSGKISYFLETDWKRILLDFNKHVSTNHMLKLIQFLQIFIYTI